MQPLVMGVLNVTPDSFSDGGCWLDPDAAVAHARQLLAEGADVIDVGGESTRPGAEPVGEDEELRRGLPVLRALAGSCRLSIDTRHQGVARAAVAAGAEIINDVSGDLGRVAADTGAGWIAVHSRGVPATPASATSYGDVVAEVTAELVARADAARASGVAEVWIDPGLGFGKDLAHNLSLVAHLDTLVATGLPVVLGASRTMFRGRLLAASDDRSPVAADTRPVPPDDRVEGSLAVAVWAMHLGVAMVRVHDVAPTVHARTLVGA